MSPNVRGGLWRVPLGVAIVAFLLGAVLAAGGQRYASDLVVGTGFVVGLLAVPLWVLTGREDP